MKRIIIVGATGMLGSVMYGDLSRDHEVIRVYRDTNLLALLDERYPQNKSSKDVFFDLSRLYRDISAAPADLTSLIKKELGDADFVINCAGIIRPKPDKDHSMTFFVNSIFPHLLSACYGERLIHISTDCVFDGKKGAPYDEKSPVSPVDIYGLSKASGELQNGSYVIRTSLIGSELRGNISLIGWMLSQPKNGSIQGYTDHIWSGITTDYCAKICRAIITGELMISPAGLVHFFSEPVSKYALLKEAAGKWRPDLTVRETKSGNPIDRRLTSCHPYAENFGIPTLSEMLEDMSVFF